MAFEGLSSRLQTAFSQLRRKEKVTEADLKDTMREIRLALLEADVNFKVVRSFVKQVRERAVGEEVLESLTAGQQIVKIVNDELTELMGGEEEPINFAEKGPTVFMMTGLQGAGKTTTAGKLANFLRKKESKKPMMIAADVYRPAAIDQLQTLGKELNIPVFSMGDQVRHVEIAKKGLEQAIADNRDLVIIDTAGRLHVDENLMDELSAIKEAVNPNEIFLVIDAMTGQDAVNVAEAFDGQLDISSVILTKLDGDTRGGAALSIRSITNKPIKFVGTGEKLDGIETFHPDRMANRILGMGDMMTLIERAQEEVDEKKAMEMAEKLQANTFDLNDFIEQMDQVRNMGPLEDLLKMIPGMNNLPGMDDLQIDPKEMDRMKAIVQSMTPDERQNPDILSQKRRKRVSLGSGRPLVEVNRMIKQFKESKKMMGSMTKGKMGGFPGKLPGKLPGKFGKKLPGGLGGLGDLGGLKDMFGSGMQDQLGGLGDGPKNETKKKKIVKKKRKNKK